MPVQLRSDYLLRLAPVLRMSSMLESNNQGRGPLDFRSASWPTASSLIA